jgi:hypothetical protein
MPLMAKETKKQPDRSPSWKVFVRIDPALEPLVEAYRNAQTYPPTLSKVVERALRLLLKEEGKGKGK